MTYENAFQLYTDKNYTEAIPAFRSLLEFEDSEICTAACYYLSKCFYELKDEAKRLYYLIQCLEYSSSSAEVFCEIGFWFMDRKEYENAIHFFSKALLCEKSYSKYLNFPSYHNFLPHLELCLCYDRLNIKMKASYHNHMAGLYDPSSKSVIANINYYNTLTMLFGTMAIDQMKKKVILLRNQYKDYPVNGVSLITVTNKPNYMNTIFENYDRMEYPKKELILVLNNNSLKIEDYKNLAATREDIHVYQLDEAVTLGECLNFGVSHATYDYIAKIDDDDFYGKHYLTDQMNCFHLPDISVATKSIRFVLVEATNSLYVFHGHGENKEVIGGGGGTIVAKKSVCEQFPFHAVNCAEDHYFFTDCRQANLKIYATDRFNYVYKRHVNPNEHTYIVPDDRFTAHADPVMSDLDYEIIASV